MATAQPEQQGTEELSSARLTADLTRWNHRIVLSYTSFWTTVSSALPRLIR